MTDTSISRCSSCEWAAHVGEHDETICMIGVDPKVCREYSSKENNE